MTSPEGFNCIFCKETFENKEDLQIHFRKHGDPNFNQNKIIKRSNSEIEDRLKPNNDQELVGCDVCSEVFPTISRAITHKHKVHPDHDAKYFCPWCGKLFTLKHLYNKHLESNHGDTNEIVEKIFHCDACDIDFNVPSAMLYHNKFFHRQDTDIPELGQSSKLRAYNQTSIPIYYCPFCGEEYENKINLHKHIVDEHNDENQSPQDVLRCPLCQAVFFHLDAYELHLTFHSPDDLYSGPNEAASTLTDYSLDMVPPMMEKVEDCQALQAAETTVQEIDVNNLLELAMEESQGLKKSKKHKKHKKSKRSAITLDEFLNMNKDVFGDGIDIQGVEEVPTKAITKRLKVINKPMSAQNPELEKLKKQGIVIKKKTNKQLNSIPNINTSKTKLPQLKNTFNQTKSLSEANPKFCSSEEVLSKLFNQKNNQLKIVKKSCTENTSDPPQNVDNCSDDLLDDCKMECDSTKTEGGASYESDNNDVPENHLVINKGPEKQPQVENSKIDDARDFKINSTEESENILATDDDDTGFCIKEDSKEIATDLDSKSDLQDQKITDSTDSLDYKEISEPEELEINSAKPNNIKPKLDITAGTINVKNIDEHESDNSTDQVENNTKNSLEPLKYLSNLTIKSLSNINNKEFNDPIKETFKAPESQNKKREQVKIVRNDQVDITIRSPLDAVKHLSGITVKSDNSLNSIEATSSSDQQDDPIENKNNISFYEASKMSINKQNNPTTINKLPLINNLKLGQNITIKSLKSSNNENDTDSESEFNNSDISNADEDDLSTECNETGEMQMRRKILNYPSNKTLPKLGNVQSSQSTEGENSEFVECNVSKHINENIRKVNEGTNLLKHLKHITAKPINKIANDTIQTSTHTNQHKPIKQNTNIIQRFKKPIVKVERNEDNIEVYNIEDSDSDDMENTKEEIKGPVEQPIEGLKLLNKNVTIKSFKNNDMSPKLDEHKSLPDDQPEVMLQREKDNMDPKLEAIKKTLKNLGSITVKSRNSSPSQTQPRLQNLNLQQQNYDSNEDSNSDSELNRVKITELDDDEQAINDEEKHDNSNSKVIVQTPDDSGSDNEFETSEDYEETADLESQIKSNTLHKSNECSDSIHTINYARKIGKDVTIKFSENKSPKADPSANVSSSNYGEQSPKPTTVFQKPNIVKNISNFGRKVNQATKQISSSNQVNKEVTVQRYQTHTKTVIQEITTTVTKTIKTVNQEVRNTNQEVRNIQSRPTFVPQKVKGMNVNSSKNLEGVVVKQSATNQILKNAYIRPTLKKIIRPSNELVPVGTSIRPSNQLVPVRPNLRLPSPRMPNRVRPSAPAMQGPRVGKPLKISPTAVIKPKRSNCEEPSGPFSCFKKPKDSLFPNHDTPSQFNHNDDSNVDFATSSQVTKNYMSATKSVKGNTMVASMQMKSETSTTSYEINKLSNMSGLKVTKMNQNKQSNEDQSQTDATKRTIDAIQRLQKQGLLVKKPRLDSDVPLNEDSDNSEGAADEDVDYNSPDE